MTHFLALASYCDDPKCSDNKPCQDCLDMCNVFQWPTLTTHPDLVFVSEFAKFKKQKRRAHGD